MGCQKPIGPTVRHRSSRSPDAHIWDHPAYGLFGVRVFDGTLSNLDCTNNWQSINDPGMDYGRFLQGSCGYHPQDRHGPMLQSAHSLESKPGAV